MNAVQPATGFAYAVGEEVVARLDCADIFDVTRGVQIAPGGRPRWTIGSVVDCIVLGGGRGYVLCVRHRGNTYVCVVPEECVEGVA